MTDGGSRGNPGHSATGIVIYNSSGEMVKSGGEYIGSRTNNQAEYEAMLYGMKAIVHHAMKPDHLICCSDSKLVINQLSGEWGIANKALYQIFREIKEVEKKIGVITFIQYLWIPRERTTEADKIVNEVLNKNT